MSEAEACIPWERLMAFGFGQLRLDPEHFWSMTLREVEAAIANVCGNAHRIGAPARQRFEALMQSHPDTGTLP